MCIRLILPLFCEISEKKLRKCSRKFLCAKKRGSCATPCLIPLTKTWKHCATSSSRQQKNYLVWGCISPCMPTPKKNLPVRKRRCALYWRQSLSTQNRRSSSRERDLQPPFLCFSTN